MAESSLAIFESLAKELRCNDEGQGFTSLRGLARMCGTPHQSFGQNGSVFGPKIDEYLAESGIQVSVLNTSNGIPDVVAAEVIGFYAEEKQNPTAKKYTRAFRAYGLRKVIQLATGYIPSNGEMRKMYTLDMVVRRTPAIWERMFSPSWIEQAESITKWKWEWSCMGQFINDAVYAYLPTDVVEALRELNPKNEDKRGRIHKHHQFLQPEIREIVVKHLEQVELLMRAAKGNMDLFKLLMVNHFGRFKLSGSDEMPLFKTQTVFMIQAS
jgi:P63C domain